MTDPTTFEPNPSEKRNEIIVEKNGEPYAKLWEIHYPESGNTTQHHKILSNGAVCSGRQAEGMRTRYEHTDAYTLVIQ